MQPRSLNHCGWVRLSKATLSSIILGISPAVPWTSSHPAPGPNLTSAVSDLFQLKSLKSVELNGSFFFPGILLPNDLKDQVLWVVRLNSLFTYFTHLPISTHTHIYIYIYIYIYVFSSVSIIYRLSTPKLTSPAQISPLSSCQHGISIQMSNNYLKLSMSNIKLLNFPKPVLAVVFCM